MNFYLHTGNSWRFILNLCHDFSEWTGQKKYCRFIILGRGRTGSNFLKGLLNSHTEIITFGELFRDRASIGWELPGYDELSGNRRLIALMSDKPQTFLKNNVFIRYPRNIAAVGFKLFYYHAQENSRRSLWDFLSKQKNLRILHLKRTNTLRMILSERKAFDTKSWTNTTGQQEQKFAVHIDYEECLTRFNDEQRVHEEFDSYFSDHPKLNLTYEDISEDYCREMIRVQNFLDVRYQALKPATFRQANQPLSEAIENFFALKKRFSNTAWERFFDD